MSMRGLLLGLGLGSGLRSGSGFGLIKKVVIRMRVRVRVVMLFRAAIRARNKIMNTTRLGFDWNQAQVYVHPPDVPSALSPLPPPVSI